jgi:hypothetical protein
MEKKVRRRQKEDKFGKKSKKGEKGKGDGIMEGGTLSGCPSPSPSPLHSGSLSGLSLPIYNVWHQETKEC